MSITATMTAPVLSPDVDLELMNMDTVVSREAGESDPLLLRQKVKSAAEIDGLRKRKAGKVASFYENQNEHIDNLLKPMDVHTAEARDAGEAAALKVKIAVNVSFAANICLAALQLYAAISSLSLALFASCVDAADKTVFDPFANLILWSAHRASKRANEKKWPARGSRFETSVLP
ncbi:hypothetical protein A1Q2_06227 [Trichosporon asahii var. asahii CBS 8904]|uniref:Uncharacterized protein n=2 Tax=Trichosporon asahii var. asahii TaxID=189963 RepID=K1VF60_TRIAC|nr:hypothetical protein A1Q1_02915 [Trichosporon asahii var. asahii CBS 2479]EJT48105.1 hypothetical protein A1Q1_02915 [Trichosporon asahii var. asahii CBS 2479]EKC99495.1 hypothetical protein A1Q2_06227 [Trichosporon asahii var. asahii CBS 8904]